MNKEQLMSLTNFLPQNIRDKASQALEKALQTIDPSKIRTKSDAIQVLNNLKQNGLPADILNRVNGFLNSPLATPIIGALGYDKKDFSNGLQSIFQPDNSALTNTSSLLLGIDQLKNKEN